MYKVNSFRYEAIDQKALSRANYKEVKTWERPHQDVLKINFDGSFIDKGELPRALLANKFNYAQLGLRSKGPGSAMCLV